MADTNVSFPLGLTYEQGIGFSENTGSWPMPEARTGILKVVDDNDNPRVLVLDYSDGLFYDISLRDGPTGNGLTKLFVDKASVSGTSGIDIAPEITFKEDTGEYERFLVNHLSSRIYVRPDKETNRSTSGYDDKGFLSGTQFTTEIYADGEPTTFVSTTKDVQKNNEIVYDRVVEGNRLQTKIKANKSGFHIVGRQQEYIVKDISVTPTNKITTEGNHQETLSAPLLWATRGEVSGLETIGGGYLSGVASMSSGADGNSTSAFYITSALTTPAITAVGDKTIVYWTSGSGNATFGGTSITTVSYSGSGSWSMLVASGVTQSGSLVITPVSTARIFDIRIYSGSISGSYEYLFDDIIEHSGNNVCPLF